MADMEKYVYASVSFLVPVNTACYKTVVSHRKSYVTPTTRGCGGPSLRDCPANCCDYDHVHNSVSNSNYYKGYVNVS